MNENIIYTTTKLLFFRVDDITQDAQFTLEFVNARTFDLRLRHRQLYIAPAFRT
jgi:hypothetical protein